MKSSTSAMLFLKSAALRSSLPRREDILPTTTPNPEAPRIITMIKYIISELVVAGKSPYPTVVIVCIRT